MARRKVSFCWVLPATASWTSRPLALAGGLSWAVLVRVRSPDHEIRGLGWEDRLLHAAVLNLRHHLMEPA
jgi:hypothetical protein